MKQFATLLVLLCAELAAFGAKYESCGFKCFGGADPNVPDSENLYHAQSRDTGHDRSDYFFVHRLEKDDEGRYNKIIVKGYVDGESPLLECEHDLVESMSERQVDGIGWVSEPDINFDGVPDLLIYLGLQAWGHVADFYDAYVWNVEGHCFEHVDGFDAIDNPCIDYEDKAISSSARSGPNELTMDTYRWKDGKLILAHRETAKIDENED